PADEQLVLPQIGDIAFDRTQRRAEETRAGAEVARLRMTRVEDHRIEHSRSVPFRESRAARQRRGRKRCRGLQEFPPVRHDPLPLSARNEPLITARFRCRTSGRAVREVGGKRAATSRHARLLVALNLLQDREYAPHRPCLPHAHPSTGGPTAMDFSAGAVIGLLRRTMPFLVFRFLIYFGITLAYVLGTGIGMGLGYFVGYIGDDPGAFSVWGGLFGFGLVSTAVYLLREYLLYLVKAGHIAVLVELMDGKELPEEIGRAHV